MKFVHRAIPSSMSRSPATSRIYFFDRSLQASMLSILVQAKVIARTINTKGSTKKILYQIRYQNGSRFFLESTEI